MPITDRRGKLGPYPTPDFPERVADVVMPPLQVTISGEITASKNNLTAGAARYDGRISDVFLSVGTSGKDDSNDLYLEAEVKVNSTTVMTTKPRVAHVSGEASTNKTSLAESGDTGSVAAVIATANSFSAGDVITVDFELTRTASPTTEMADAICVIELSPDF